MVDFLIPYETDLFFQINGTHSYFTDCVMELYSGRQVWFPVILSILITIVYKRNWKEWLVILLFFIVLGALSDRIAAGYVKPFFARPRPTSYPGVMEYVRLFGGRQIGGKGLGFVSCHATNAFGFATFSVLLFRNKLYFWVIMTWALIMGYSRVYLGVHFVSDVIGGMILGITIGFITYTLYRLSARKFFKKNNLDINPQYPDKRLKILSLGIVFYILFFSLSSPWLITFLK